MGLIVATAFEAPAIVSSFDNVAVMSEAIEQRGRHLGVGEDAGPFAKGKIGGDDDRGALVKPADEIEQQLTAGLGEGQIAEFIEDNEVHAGQVIGKPALPGIAGFDLEAIDEIDHVVEPPTDTGADAASGDGDGKMGFAGACPADQHGIALLGDEVPAGKLVDECLVDRRAIELEVGEVLGERCDLWSSVRL